MSSPDLTDGYVAPDHAIPKIGLFTMLRLGVFNMGLGIMSLLTLGVLNRVMIDELRVPALVAAGAIAVHQFMAPARIWIGQMSDSKPLFGYHRSGYIWLGIVSMAMTAFIAVQIVWQIGSRVEVSGWNSGLYPWVGLLAFVFALYGLALSSTSTPFTALLVDVSDDETQSKLVGIGWGMLMVGIVSGVIITTIVLKSLGDTPTLDELRGSINRLFIIAPSIVCGLAILSTFGIEKKYSRLQQRSRQRDDQITFGTAIKVLTASRQTGLFFIFLLVLSLSLFMQDAVLEPYGGQIFGMAIAETTQLNAYFGMGTLFGIVATGFF
ncbi:MAG: BCD family MFS transporter, partial [Cyanobacteria bacterium J06607_17]